MNILVKRYLSIVGLVILALAAGVAGAEKKETKQLQRRTVLLAYEHTPFKKSLMDEMAANLGKQGVEAVVLDHTRGRLDREDASAYGAVFISASGVNSQVRPWIREWLGKQTGSFARIILHVTQTRNWKVEAPVDSVTSASAPKEVGQLAARYAAMVLERLDSGSPK
jgi:hypothetical protein